MAYLAWELRLLGKLDEAKALFEQSGDPAPAWGRSTRDRLC